jgi:ferrous iron transport protein B
VKILLMGHPNVGKSALCNRLAETSITESNYPGTTVDYTESDIVLDGQTIPVVDVPGTFSLQPKDRAEEVAVEILEANLDALVICVIDATRFERGLNLTLEIIERGYDVVLALNMWDEAVEANIDIDVETLEDLLGVPVVPTVATRGTGMEELAESYRHALSPSVTAIQARVYQRTVGHHSGSRSPVDESASGAGS